MSMTGDGDGDGYGDLKTVGKGAISPTQASLPTKTAQPATRRFLFNLTNHRSLNAAVYEPPLLCFPLYHTLTYLCP